MDRQQEFVLRTLEERDIRFVRLWFTDVLGYLKSVAVAPAELEGAFTEGIGFDGSAIEGFARVYESDMVARPDPSTFQVLPWETAAGRALLGADVLRHRDARRLAVVGGPAPRAAPRAEQGRRGRLHLLRPPRDRVLPAARPDRRRLARRCPPTHGGYFDQASHDVAPHFRRNAIETLESMGISVEFSHHEGGPGQQEIDLRYADALTMADNIMTFRYVVKEVAITQGVRASFMPKPFTHHPGSAMHTHFSLFEGDRNAFHDPDDPYELSDDRQGVRGRRAPARPRDLRGHQPVGELLQAARSSAARPRRPSAGGTPTVPRWSGCRCTRPASRRRAGWRCGPWTAPATRTWPTP